MLSHPFRSFLQRIVDSRRPRRRFAGRAGRPARLLRRVRLQSSCHSATEALEDRLLLAATLSPPFQLSGLSWPLSTGQPAAANAAPATAAPNTVTASTTMQLKTADSSPPSIGGLASQINVGENGGTQFWPTLTDAGATATSDSLSLSVTNGRLQLLSTNGLTFTSGANGSSSMTMTGTLANLNAAVYGVDYSPTIGYVGADALQLTLANSSDGLSGSASASINLIVPPSVGAQLTSTVGATATVLNNSSYTFAAGTFALSDINASGTSDSAQIFIASVANGPGTVTLGTTVGVSMVAGSNGSSSMTINGTLANLNAAINTLTYTPNAAFTGEAQVYVILRNSLNGLEGANATTFDVLDPNGPSVTAPASDTLALNQSLAFTGTNAVSVTDPGASGTSDSVRIALSFGTVSLGTTSGLTFTNGSNNSNLMTVTGTLADLNAALSTLTYTAQNSFAGPNPLYITVTNSVDNLTAADIVLMTVASPVVTAPTYGSLNESGSLTFSGGSISVADPGAIYNLDGFAYESVTLSAANGTLALGSTSGLLWSIGSNNSSMISVTGTLANVNAALNGLVYTPNGGFTGSDALQISFKDCFDGLIASATVPLEVGAPTVSAPSHVTLNEFNSYNFAGTIGVADPTAYFLSDLLTLSVSNGGLTFSSTAGLTFGAGSNGSASMTVNSTLDGLNAALRGLQYTPSAGFGGADSLQLTLVNLTNHLTASAVVSMTVNPPPAVSAPASAIVPESGAYRFPGTISLTDQAASGNSDVLDLWVGNGTLTLGSTNGITFVSGSNGSLEMMISGTLANLNSALYGLTYTASAGFTGQEGIQFVLANGIDRMSGWAQVVLTIDAPPTVTAPPSLSIYQNIPYTFANAINVGDPTASGASDTVLVAVNHGTLNLGSTTGITVTGGYNGSSSINFSGTLANLNAALNGLVYSPSLPYYGADSLTVRITDPEDSLTASATVAIAITGDVPVITAPYTAGMNENASYTFPGTASITDPYPLATTEVLSLFCLDGILTLGSTSGLTFRGNSVNNSQAMTVIGTLANVNAALDGLVYTPMTGYYGTTQVGLAVTGTADNLTALGDVTITVKELLPSIIAPPSAGLSENSSVNFMGAISVADANASGNSDSVTLSVADGSLSLGSTNGLIFSSGSNGSSSMTFSGTLTNVNAALDGLVYASNPGYSGSDSLQISIRDSANSLSGSTAVAISVIAPPSVTAPANASLAENSSYTFSNTISVADATASGTSDSVSLSVTSGTLSLGTTAGITITTGSNGTSSMTVTGTLASLNAALNGLVYVPSPNYSGSDSLKISVIDSGDHLTGSGTVGITVNAVTAPSVTAPSTASLKENSSYTFSGAAISVTDAVASGTSDSLTLSVANGKLTLGSTTGLTFSTGSNNSSSMTVIGTLANLNAALSGLVYTPTAGFSGHDSLQISVNDASDKLTGSAAVAIAVNPYVTAPATASVLENTTYAFSTSANDPITVTDGAASGTSDSLTLTVLHGKLTLASIAGLTFTAGANGSSSLTVNGTLASLNAALNGLIYAPTTGYTGPDTLTVTISDAVDGLSGSASVAITVASKQILRGAVIAASTNVAANDEFHQWASVTAPVDVHNA